ncbi:MAG: hypothetical protein EBU84_17740, partial [Actinobacteria bacterium]|nr:hypothetical protein [Actinomycetota bacterium]
EYRKVSMNDIKKSLIKIAYTNPNIRKDIIDITQNSKNTDQVIKGIIKLAYNHPEIREEALAFIKDASQKDRNKLLRQQKRKKEKASNNQQKKPESSIPKPVYDAAKNKSLSNIQLNEYLREELKGKGLPNPNKDSNKKEVAVSTLINHVTNNDEYAEDSKKILDPVLDRVIETYEKETETEEEGAVEGAGEESVEEVSTEETTKETEETTKAQPGSPQEIAENAEKKTEEKINEEIDRLTSEPEETLDNRVDEISADMKGNTATEAFKALGVPNAEEVGEAVKQDAIDSEKERREAIDTHYKIIDEVVMPQLKEKIDSLGELKHTSEELKKAIEETEPFDIETAAGDVDSIREHSQKLNSSIDAYYNDPTIENAKEILKLLPASLHEGIGIYIDFDPKVVASASISLTEATEIVLDGVEENTEKPKSLWERISETAKELCHNLVYSKKYESIDGDTKKRLLEEGGKTLKDLRNLDEDARKILDTHLNKQKIRDSFPDVKEELIEHILDAKDKFLKKDKSLRSKGKKEEDFNLIMGHMLEKEPDLNPFEM